MKKMMMTASVPSMIGQFNMNNIRTLIELGYEVHVACDFCDRSVWTEARVKDLEEKLKKMGVKCYQVNFPRNPINIKNNLKSYRQVKKIMNKEQFEFIHCHTPVCGVITRIAARINKIKVIYTAHGFHFCKGAPLKNWLIYYPVEWICSFFTDVLITINQEDYDLAKKHLHAKYVEYVPGVGIDTKKFMPGLVNIKEKRLEFGIEDDEILLLSVGELSERKNHEMVIRAIAKLQHPKVRYFICGIGSLEEKLRKLIRDLNIEKQVTLLGYRTDIAELCSICDLFVFPSKQEGLPVALMEAIASCVPVICSRIRGNEDLVKDYLFNTNDIEELSNLLNNLLTTREHVHHMMEQIVWQNYSRLETYDLVEISKKMLYLYKMIGKGNAHTSYGSCKCLDEENL